MPSYGIEQRFRDEIHPVRTVLSDWIQLVAPADGLKFIVHAVPARPTFLR